MAASSGGADWSSIIKPFLCASHENFNKNELVELCSSIIKNEAEILRFKESNKVFYNSFAALAADFISFNVGHLSFNHLEIVVTSCRVLLKYLVAVLQTLSREGRPNTVQAERCLKAIRTLCVGFNYLTQNEIIILTNIMKGETLPPDPTATVVDKDVSNKQENTKTKSDLSVSIYEQLTLPLRDGRTTSESGSTGQVNIATESLNTSNDPTAEIKKLFLSANTENLQSLRAGDTLMDLCLSLPVIRRARTKIEDALAGKPFILPTTHLEATSLRNSLQSTVADINLLSSAISLPVLEPLTPSKLDKLCTLSMASLYCAISQAAASCLLSLGSTISPKCTSAQAQAIKEEDLDTNAVTLVEEALNMHTFIGNVIKNSTRAGGHVYQNHLLSGAWVLISGLQTHLMHSTTPVAEKTSHTRERDDKGRSPSKSREVPSSRSSLIKFQQSFGVLSVALASRALTLLTDLFDDLHLEVCGSGGPPPQIEPAPLTIMGQFSALQRVARLLSAAPLNQLLFYLATVSYRKACTLKRIHPPEGDTFSQSDSTTYYEDMILCTDESSTEDDDSEPILGQWFEETLAPPDIADTKNVTNSETNELKAIQSERANLIVPEKGEAYGYISLATQIFVFLNRHFLCTKSCYVERYVTAGLSEQQMFILAAIIRDLDRETSRTENGTISAYFGVPLGQLYCEFSSALTRFTHNLITHSSLSNLQRSLLGHLGVSPWNAEMPHTWPLLVYPRTLGVLAQVLLLKPQNEKEASVISIWHKLVNTLIENVINPSASIDAEIEDLNVEHAQVLLYLFHSLNLMQKKSVVLLMAGGVLRCSEVAHRPLRDSQLLHLSRLLLLFDYIMKHLYDAPPILLEQIQWNLLSSTNFNNDKEKENNTSRMYTSWHDIEDNYRKVSGNEELSMKPRFYVVTNVEINNQDAPKLDGLACNFILGTPDKLRYPLLLDALIEILSITHITSGSSKMSHLGLCAMQYCFTICWRLLQMLPPSSPYMEKLASNDASVAGPILLHTLIWGPRTNHKNFSRWLKDALVKQGMYTQHAEKLLKAVSDSVNTLKYDVATAKNCIVALTPDIKKGIVAKESLPPLWHLFLLDSVLAKVQVSLIDEIETNTADSSGITISGAALVQDLLPHVLRLTQAILHCIRWSFVHCMVHQSEPSGKFTLQDFDGLLEVLAISSSRNLLTSGLATELNSLLPSTASSVLQQWNVSTLEDCTWTPYLNDIIPSESYILKIIETHTSTLSLSYPFSINLSLRRLLQCLVKFICQHAPKTENTDTKNKAIELLVLITLDLGTEFLYENVSKTLDKMIGDTETDEHQKRVYLHFLEHSYKLINNYTSSTTCNVLDEKILHGCLKFYEKILEKSSGRQALECFFTGDKDLVKVLMSVSSPQMSQQYSTRVLHFFNKLFQAAEKSSTDPSLNYLCSSMSKLANVNSDKLQVWLRHIILGPNNISGTLSLPNTPTATFDTPTKLETCTKATTTTTKQADGNSVNQWGATQTTSSESNPSPSPSEDQKSLVQENSQLLQALTLFIVKQNSNVSEDVSVTILKALLPVASHILSPSLEGVGFTDLMVVMTMLADAGIGRGHTYLFPSTVLWLEVCKEYLTTSESINKLISYENETTKNCVMLEAACCLLDYVGDLVVGLNNQTQSFRALSPPWEGETFLEVDMDWPDETNVEEDSGDDSDEDALCNKLCTFTVTQKEFMNQHWYHCHTCHMLDGVGVCSVCARVCHRGHELTYAKFGNFFCDCGAKDDGSCQALVKRSPQSATATEHQTPNNSILTYAPDSILPSSLRRRASSPISIDKFRKERKVNSVKQLEGSREYLADFLGSSTMIETLIKLVNSLMPVIYISCTRTSPVGCHGRAINALEQLHSANKKYIYSDQLMIPTLGSQEGAFENVRMSYAGEQGQTIRQLLSAHIVRRVAMCCMSSPHGKRQHLAVSHEKGKITILQLSSLLKQADSASKKLTLTRLATAPIPFTVLTLAGNPCNEEYLAVCGLKDCHILTFLSTGTVSDHLVLHPQLETGNFIIKAIWLPGSQSKLALVTADFVKIYDLGVDALSPQYYFLVPSGKIRDCTFMYEDGVYNILLMSSPGHIYIEVLNDGSSARHGTFYVTNTLEVLHLDVTDVNGQVAGGGVSIHYSHILRILCYSYVQGKSFISPITPRSNRLSIVFPITIPNSSSATSKSNGGKSPNPQPLCQWTEIASHPGLICCAMQSSNNPIVIMLKPDVIAIQEIKVVPSKSKITDMVATRQNSGIEQKTTLILLCDDGSLKIFMAQMDHTGFWMSPTIQPAVMHPPIKARKKKVVKPGKTSSSLSFPVDFFEHCQQINDVEIGGNDLLQAYNVAQLKHRLNTAGLYVVCTKPLGFNVEITNSDNNVVMTGIRVLVGTQDPHKAPSFIEVFGRIITISVSRSRWFDVPFNREESLQSDKKLTVMFGPSQDPEIITMIDSIKVYGKTKELFGWPEEHEENTTSASVVQPVSSSTINNEVEQTNVNAVPLNTLERLIVGILEVLDGSFTLYNNDDKLEQHKPLSISVATILLTLPSPPALQLHAKSLLSALHPSKQSYHSYKDNALLEHTLSSLISMTETDPKNFATIDAENYYRLVMIVRGIAVARPQNLVKFADSQASIQDVVLDDPLDVKIKTGGKKNQNLLLQLMDVLWILHSQNHENPALAPVVVPGLKHVEQVVHALVEIVHAFNSCDSYSNITIAVYLQLLLCEDATIAFSAKQALNRVLKPKCRRRRVFIPSPPHCGTPLGKGNIESDDYKLPRTTPQSSQEEDSRTREGRYDVDMVESIAMLQQPGISGDNHNINPLEALLGSAAGFPPLLDIPPDADDETMVELAIALSLQEHELGGNIQQGQQELDSLQVAGGQVQESSHYSDTTVSAAGSDDEGSTAATDGSTLRTSPAEQGGSAGSESGGSGVDSITGEHNVSGRSSAYGDNMQEAINLVSRSDTSSLVNANFQAVETDSLPQEVDPEQDSESSSRLHILRLQLLERLIEYLPKLQSVNGIRAVPFLQVVLQLTTNLDGQSERDKTCLNSLLVALANELQMNKSITNDISERNSQREVQLVIMRLLSVLMSRSKFTTTSTKSGLQDNSMFIAQTTATVLHKAEIISYCLKLLQSLLEYWRNFVVEEGVPNNGGNLLKEHLLHPPPDMTPLFLKQYVKGGKGISNVFQSYPQLLTEMALRLPYQVYKHSEISEQVGIAFEHCWYKHLCEYMMASQVPFVRRQVRKLLLFICGNKEKYRQLRDVHALNTHMKAVRECCSKVSSQTNVDEQLALSLPYDTSVELVEHLKACLEIALGRTGNWQKFCIHNDGTLSFLLKISYFLDEGVAPTILHLLQCAIVIGTGTNKKSESGSSRASSSRKDRERSDDSATDAIFEETSCAFLVEQINKQVSQELFSRIIKTFLLETNATNIRWQAHALILAIYKNSKPVEQELLLKLLWQLWPYLPSYGRKASQFVDLLGYFSLRYSQTCESAVQISEYVDKAVNVLRAQNELLAYHPNANLYSYMGQFVELDGYYLESEPCLVCNNPEVPQSTIKLSSIKVDSKFTTTTQIIKLISSHTISKITVKIGELKRTKMVRTINIFYNNRSVQAVVELKNKPALWHKAKKVNLQSGQTEIKIEFPLPIIACNLMVEYSEFYENIQANSETLQCPRCSASVPANPGVCANCGENVFQCHKCRAINYDEKDPFLCHSCGFCKYAKFEFTLLAKPCCAVEPIENDEDRKKMVTSINNLLEKADRVYKQLMANKPLLESLLLKIIDNRSDRKTDESSNSNAAVNITNAQSSTVQVKVNKTIQMLAQQYCNECKTSFEELSKIIQKVLVSRKELVAYDRKHRDIDASRLCTSSVSSEPNNGEDTGTDAVPPRHGSNNRCYGCSSAAMEHCLTLLRALATNANTRQVLFSRGLIQELVFNNLRKGSVNMQEEVRQLLCVLTRDNSNATEELCNLLMKRIKLSLDGHINTTDIGAGVRYEMALLAAMVQKEDDCWELKLRCLMRLFLKACEDSRNPLVMESIILPCLKILQSLMKSENSKRSKDKANVVAATQSKSSEDVAINVHKWLNKDPRNSFVEWKHFVPQMIDKNVESLSDNREQVHKLYLAEKYVRKWKKKVKPLFTISDVKLDDSAWLKNILFNPSSRLARQVTCNIIELMCSNTNRKREVLLLMTCFLKELGNAGENSAEFLTLYQNLIQETPWKQYLTLHGVLISLAKLVTQEIKQLHRLEQTTLTSDLAQGYALYQLTELLSSFLENSIIRRLYKSRLVGSVLNGYLSLRRLVVQRTRLIDDTQEKLLELLEEMTTGTEEETKAFMSICIDTVEKYSLQDVLTPVFIFERLCSIIYPEENDVGEYFLTLEKDSQQEDFLQGRMLGNPYSSLEAGLGPLMRDVKNKICQDCELVALLEDDNGMELLVNNKIMSLDLPVKDVYKKVWIAEGGEVDAMRIVYRMRGLLGDATEEFVETLNNKSQHAVDNEEVYKMANVLADCGGLKIMVTRLGAIQNIWRARPLVQVLLKLFRLSVKVQRVQEVLIQPELGAMGVFLHTLQLCLDGEPDVNQSAVTEQLLDIMETVLSKATSKSIEPFEKFALTFGGPQYVSSLLSCTTQASVRSNQAVLIHLTRVLAALVYGNEEKMNILLEHFQSVLNFNKYDFDHSQDEQQKLEMFCVLTDGIERNAIGNTLKDHIISLGVVEEAVNYITLHAPCVKPTLLRTDSDELKEFISKPALKYVLRFLTGLASNHEKTQLSIAAAETIPIIHRLEQVSSDEHVGSLAENLLEALRTNEAVAKCIEEVRDFTRSEKKRLAMAMREKQLGQLGMHTNDKGQVTAKSSILQQMEELGEETGLVCCICREGYKYQSAKVLGIYTFTKRCNVEEVENKSRKTVGYSTVTHFNVVHVDCHMSAVRLARARDEWESAALQNANTKCNGLLPLWGPQVPESAFASCLARHNTYLQESTNHRDIGHGSTIHDLKLLLLRFAQEKSFHEDTGGGGPQSNMHLIPYLIHMALYVINTTRVSKREEAALRSYLDNTNMEKWIESAFEADGPLYWITMSMLVHSETNWSTRKLTHLRRLIVLAQARCCKSNSSKTLVDKTVKEYDVYKPYFIFYGLIDNIYYLFFKNINGSDENWSSNLADYIRHNDEALLKASERLLGVYTDELLPCTSFMEFCDVAGLLNEISDPENYISNLLNGV